MSLRTVLVVDDVPLMREIVRNVMRPHCQRIVCASTCEEASEILEQEPDAELMITDLYLPDGDGFEILEAIQARSGSKPLAILMTARYSSEVEERARSLGAIGVIAKPIALRDLERVWTEELERRKHTRRPTSAPVQVNDHHGQPLVTSQLLNISMTGAFIATPLTPGSEVELEISLGDHVVRSRALVVRLQEPSWLNPAGSGVCFEAMGGESRSALEEAMRELPEDGEALRRRPAPSRG
jgi:CheY-like chemotaxis protein